MNSLKNKIQNTKINFSKNLIFSLVIPAIVLVFALVLGIVFGFNKGLDFNGGLMVNIVAENYNLEDGKQYNEFITKVNSILKANRVSSAVCLIEKDSQTQEDILVVKIAYNGSEEKQEALVEALKSDLISEFFASATENEIERRNLVEISMFGSSVSSWVIVSSILASLITAILICIYVGFRNDLFTSVLCMISSIVSNVLAFALIVVSRIQTNAYTVSLIPFITIISSLITYLFCKNAKELSKSDKYERKQNNVLANDTIKNSLFSFCLIGVIGLISTLAFALINVCNPVLWLGLSLFVAIIAICHANLFIIPSIFALTYVRRVKKEKVKKQETQKLNESEVLKETDLDNLVSN